MARDSFIKFHLEQAERYSRALSDPMYVSEYSARFLAQSINYHRSMADWYMSEPERPKEEFSDADIEAGILAVARGERHLVEKVSRESSGTREDTDDSQGSDSNTNTVER